MFGIISQDNGYDVSNICRSSIKLLIISEMV